MPPESFANPEPEQDKPARKKPSRASRPVAAAAANKTIVKKAVWQQIVARATETFGTQHRAIAWLRRPAAPLQNRTPQSLIATEEGLRQVEQLLGKIDHGIGV
jgi:putative toxin-antitoxin system antitoxin component (TIGR02293 family)